MTGQITLCDSHCHVATAWFAPVESLLGEMDQNGVERAVLVQIRGQFDNTYLFECAQRFPGRFATVVGLDTARPDALDTLARLADRGAAGVRLRVDTRSPGDDPLAVWRAAAGLGLAVSCLGTAASFASDDFAYLLGELPTLPVVLEHLAGLESLGDGGRAREQEFGRQAGHAPSREPGDDAPPAHVRERVLALARFPNVSAKLHGLGEFCVRAMPVHEPFPFVRPIPPLLDELYAAFGPDRLMWASDYPPVSIREGYRLALRLVADELAGRSESARRAIFGGTASRIFPLHR